MLCKSASKVPAKWPRHTRAFPVGLTYSSLAIDDDRYASNEIETNITMFSRFPARFFSLAISRPLRPVSPIWIMRPRSCSDDTWRCRIILNDCRTLKLFHVPSTTHAALPSSTFNTPELATVTTPKSLLTPIRWHPSC